MSKRLLAEDKLEENDSYRPYVDLMRYLGRVLLEAFRSLIPVRSNSLRSQLNLLIALVNNFAETEVSYLDFTVVEYYILRLEVVVNDLLFAIIQVLEPT